MELDNFVFLLHVSFNMIYYLSKIAIKNEQGKYMKWYLTVQSNWMRTVDVLKMLLRVAVSHTEQDDIDHEELLWRFVFWLWKMTGE